ncbi:MAG: DNA-processing protein DprA [Trueperaceae bacterium]
MTLTTHDTTLAYLTLLSTKGLGPRKIKLLLEHFGSSTTILDADSQALSEVEGFGTVTIGAIQEAKKKDWAEKELGRAEKLNIGLVHFESEAYPQALKQIYDPPPLLYVRGTLPASERAIGIVGTRDASDYAMKFSESLARELGSANVTVVSGLALGIDSAAHRGAISTEQGQTIAVLGSAVNVIYPKQNETLAKHIEEGHGAVISEYPIGTVPTATNFPGRNRIINGLSKGIVVVEAGEKSGALITSDYALEEGRTVFAVPGRVGDTKAKGTLALLKQGAVLVQSVDDILNEFGWICGAASKNTPSIPLSGLEEKVFSGLKKFGNPLLDDLLVATELPVSELLKTLTLLELKGVVKQLPGGRYTAL